MPEPSAGGVTVAVASGKGGTGKTTVAVNLALVASRSGWDVSYIDCDVEEPNGHLFLRPEIARSRPVKVPVPEVDAGKCTGCGACARICAYSAIVCVKRKVLVFPELCHGCGGCVRVCPPEAIREVGREVGVAETGAAGAVRFAHGRLRVGEAMSPPLIRAVKEEAVRDGARVLNLIDAPPGTSCPVIAAVRGADLVLLVTEPTPFGLNDLGLAMDMVGEVGLPHAVVINRHDEDNSSAREFCAQRGVRILAEIPDDRRVAEAYSRGDTAVEAVPGYAEVFGSLWTGTRDLVAGWRKALGQGVEP